MNFLDNHHVSAAQLAALCLHWKVRELALFGSVARGEEHADSDVDMLLFAA